MNTEEHTELTEDEEVHYANYAYIEICDVCHNYFALHLMEFDGDFFICSICNGPIV